MATKLPGPKTPYEQTLLHAQSQLWMQGQPFETMRQKAFGQFESVGIPTRKEETWRFIDLSPITKESYKPSEEPALNQLTPQDISQYLLEDAFTLVFVNGIVAPHLSSIENLPSGVVFGEFSTNQIPLEPELEAFLKDENDPFALVNTAFFRQGALIQLSAQKQLQKPLNLVFITQPNGLTPSAVYPRIHIHLEAQSQANVLCHFVSLNDIQAPTLTNGVLTATLDDSAQLNATQVVSATESDSMLLFTRATLNHKSQFDFTSLVFGGKLVRNDIEVHLNQPEASCSLNGLSILTGNSKVHDHTVIRHQVPECSSKQLYKGVLKGQARLEFDGTIVIDKDAQQSSAQQLNQTLLLSEEARVITRPQLRIDADEVKCTHGATIGQLSEEELFYFTSRGIAQETASQVMTQGFAQEIVNLLPHASIRMHLTQKVGSERAEEKPDCERDI